MSTSSRMYSLVKTVLIFNLFSLCVLFLIRQLNNSTLIADQILAVGLFALVCTGILFFLLKNNISSEKKWIKILSLLVSFLLYLNVSTQLLINTDRSRSFFVLEWIQCAPPTYSINQIQNRYTEVYGERSLKDFNLRYNEQVSRQLINDSENPTLSTRGLIIYKLAEFLAKSFKLKGWYSNALWDKECN